MRIKKPILIILLLLFLQTWIFGQSINNIQFPPSINWKQIETEYCILIFPENLTEQAEELAEMLDSFYPADEYSLNTKTDKWPVIINNTLINTNGYVLGAPRHSQLYTIPPQDGLNGTSDWLPFLWSHELRHIVQEEKMNRGFTAFAGWLAGEYGISGMSHFAVPVWLWEGDAVLTETLLSSSGRGRLAGFEREMRTNLLNGIKWNYYKAGLGYYASYRSRVPSWYIMGYHLCTYIRQEYGIEAFNRIIEISADFSFTPLILNIAVKKVTGKSIESIYKDCIDELTEIWSDQLSKMELTASEIVISAEIEDNTNYYPLGEFNKGGIAVLRTSASSIFSLMEIDKEGKEHLLRKIAPIDTNISFNGSSFCWAESRQDIRWGNSSTSVIRLYNPEENTFRIITDKTRYLSPSISPDGKRIAAVEITDELENFIVVLDAADGRLISRTAEPAGASPSETCWTADSKNIVYIRQQNWQKSLRALNPDTKINLILTEPREFNIAAPAADGEFVYYVSEEYGLENIHALRLADKKSFITVSRPFGTASPAPAGNRLLFADYSASGYAVATVDIADMLSPDEPVSGAHVDYFEGLEVQEAYYGIAGQKTAPDAENITTEFKIENYYPALGLFNFHSRGIGTSMSGTGITLNLQADGIMNNSSGRLYGGYDSSSSEFMAGLSGAWAGFFPVLLYGAEIQTPLTGFGSAFESNIYGGIWLPLDFSLGIYNNTLSMQGIFQMENALYPAQDAKTAVQGRFNWRFTEDSAKRDIIPPAGFMLTAEWYSNIIPANYNFIFGEAAFYLPGLLENHGFEIKLQTNYNFESAVANRKPNAVPRGYKSDNYEVPLLLAGSINYTLPLAYPDFNLGGFLYISRLSVNCFLDTAAAYNAAGNLFIQAPDSILQSTGIELFTDFHLFNSYVPLHAGLRFIYDTINGGIRLEDTVLLIGIDLL